MVKITSENSLKGITLSFSMIVSVEKGMIHSLHFTYIFKESMKGKYRQKKNTISMKYKKKMIQLLLPTFIPKVKGKVWKKIFPSTISRGSF